MDIDVNVIAVAVAALLGMFIGYVWYAPFGFGPIWAKHAKIDLKKPSSTLAMVSAMASMVVMAYGLAYAAGVAQAVFGGRDFLQNALLVGLFVWICFQALRMFQRAQFNQDSHAETAIHLSNELVTVIAMSFVVGMFGIQ